jgi:predicted metal-dependent peptidase
MSTAPQFAILDESKKEYDYPTLNRDLDRAKSAVFMGKDAAFFGSLMCTLDFVWSRQIETAGTNGSYFWWNPDDFLRCDVEERKSTIMHELWHVARLHPMRRGNRCPDIWNHACDIKINRDLRQQGYFLGPDWIDEPDFDLIELEEEIYDLLPKNPGSPGNQGQPQPGQSGQQPMAGSGSKHGKCQHASIQLSPQDKQKMINSAVKAVQSAKLNAGNVPGGIEIVIDKFLAPKIPWQAALYMFFNDLLNKDYSWARPNRRYTDMYLPSQIDDDGRLEHLIYYLDVSGSISDHDVLRFNSEVKYIKDTFNPVKLTLVLFDTVIQQEYVFTEDDPFEKVIVTGRGGTSLVPVREHIMEHKPTAAIIFTDLAVTPMEPGPQCPIIWVSTDDATPVPFGKLIILRD